MNDPFLFKTLCVGGPLDGESVTEAVGRERFTHHRVLSGCEVLPGDDIVPGLLLQSEVTQEDYVLVMLCLPWPSGTCWLYSIWLHESLAAVSAETVLESQSWHPSECYVTRKQAEIVHEQSPFFYDGRFTLSEN